MSYFEFPHTRSYDGDLGYIIKRLDELTAKYGEFMEYNQIKFADPVEWSIARQYEAWELVFDVIWQEIAPGEEQAIRGYNLYMSIKPVPKGINIHNEEYWQLVLPFTIDTELNIESNNVVTNHAITSQFDTLAIRISGVISDLENETTARTSADDALSDRITTNSNNIATNADNITANTNNIAAQTLRIDNLASTITPGGTSGDAELIDIRVGANGITYLNAGEAVRDQIGDINDAIDLSLTFEQITGSIRTDTYIDGDGTITTAMGYSIETVSVTPGDILKITAKTYYLRKYFGFYDSGNDFISGLSASEAGTSILSDYIVVAPNNAAKLVVVYVTSEQNNRKISIKTGVSSDINTINNNIGLLNENISVLDSSFAPQYTALTGTTTADTYIDSSGSIATANGWTTEIFSVEEFKTYKIKTQAYQLRSYYSFFDSSDNVIEHRTAETTSILNDTVSAPAGAVSLALVSYTALPDNRSAAVLTSYNSAGDWINKKWVVVGDSLTEENIRTTKHYFDYVSEKTGLTTYNMGVSGTGYMRGYDRDQAFYQRIYAVPTDADVITIFGSFNDLALFSDLGTATDTGTSTIGGCINTTLDNLFTAYPLANVGIITPCPWQSAVPYTPTNQASQYVALIIEICKLRGIPCLDLFHCSQLRPWEESFRELAYTKDEGGGTHPDETGHKILAPQFEGFLNTLLLK